MKNLIPALISLALLGVAIWQAVVGNWPAAIFIAIVWHGYTSNRNAVQMSKIHLALAGVKR